ncbi:hypothetical protein [uncultured Clostridium sp.]|uniref:hypothetical protein n=1 Tax=uncultured Clostridium sp. TaxID=59620 RepID=UPI00263B34E0|nr:hypothetical protein [uncultured Clostridium sp.]
MIKKLNDYIVPRGIRFISELGTNFRFYKFPVKCIINKQLPGCGFTEYCLRGPENVILCSPRKMLLENKKDQHGRDVYLVVNELEKELTVDKDLNKVDKTRSQVFIDTLKEVVHGKDTVYNRLMNEIKDYLNERKYLGDKPCKILVTYDSYRIVKDILESLGIFQSFYTVIDEFQTILHDSKFKSNTELEFLDILKQSHSALFVSATPMLEEYLNMLDEFDGLPYINMDWASQDPTRVLKPSLKVLTMKSVGTKLPEIIQSYKDGNFERAVRIVNGYPREIISDEAVFYVNSVNHIVSIIKKCDLQPEEVNILCSNTPENLKKIQRKLGKKFTIGKIPLKGVKPKMFTFCTRTVYLGADFNSLCARSFIFSDSNIDSLAVDISEDLPQILGRQRLFENPWKNEATFYYRSTCDYRKISQEEFDKELERKKKSTNNLLRSFESAPDDAKHDLAERYQTLARTQNYKDDYIAVNEHQRSNLVPVLNNLVLVNEIRAFKIQQIDYKDRFTVFSTIYNTLSPDDIVNQEVSRFLEQYQKFGTFKSKLKYLCEYSFNDAMTNIILDQIGEHDNIKSYYLALGPEKLRALGYNKTYIEKELGIVTFSQELLESNIYSEFKVGDKITLADIKSRLEVLYKSINYDATPKAKDLENYFNVKESSARVEIDGVKKVVKIYNIISKKEVC